THENNGCRTNIHARLGSRDVHDRLGRRRSLSKSPPSSDSEDSRRKRHKRVSSSLSDSSDKEDEETGHWKSRNGYRNQEAEDMSHPWRHQKVDAFTRRITATIENWPQPVWCHMFNSTLVGNARNWFSKLPRRSIDGFEELRRALNLNFTQRKKCAKNPVELARVKQRQGESTSAYVERYKDECIHVKACPEILKISRFMNGINNPELIKRLNDRNIKEGKDKQKSTGKKDTPKDKADTIYMVQSWQRKTRQKVSQKFSRGSKISFPTLTADNTVVEPLTIEINAGGHDIHRMYIDGGASADILYEHCFQRLRPEVKSQLNPATTTPSPYNGIIGRPGISAIRAVPSMAHGMLKFPVDGGIVTIYNTTVPPRECNTVSCDATQTQTQTQHTVKVINLKVAIHPDYPEQEVSIGGSLSDRGRAAMCALLQRNLYIFAWEPKHMTEAVVPAEIRMPTIRTAEVNVVTNDEERRIDLDLLEERRKQGMFLGYLIEPDGIKPCLEKIKAVIQLPSPRTMKEVQSLNGKLAGLNRFLSKSADKSLPLFKTLKKCTKKGDFRWTTEAEEAFIQLKQHIATLPTAVLLTDRNSVQTPVYFVSKALKKTEVNYSAMEKLVLALVFAAKRLRKYFQAHPIVSVLLGEHNISYRLRIAVKGQILADFIIEKPDTNVAPPRSKVKLHELWILFTDGSSCMDGSGVVLMEILKNKSISEMEISTVIEEQNPTWMTPIIEFISKGTLPHEQKDARRIWHKAQRFKLRDGILYRMHSGPRSVVARALRSGYYWPTMHRDARGLKFLIVAIDYFTKWIEAKAVATITVKHLQTNGLVERANRSLGEGIKVCLDKHKGRTEAVIPAEIGMPTIRTAEVNVVTNDDERRIDLDLLEERRERAAICEAKAKSKMKGYYDAKVRGVSFRPDDFVYRANDASHVEDAGKPRPKWEGPYEVTEALGNGAYKLCNMDGRELPRTWNICNLKRCYL
nr:reverse transcriptase domain-containing protein [Tanacetum cinerariifolium]